MTTITADDRTTMQDQFQRSRLLYGSDALDTLANAHVAVFGIGGVGGYVAESLARAGIGRLDIIDKDTVDITNINRQIIATHDVLGCDKVDVMAKRISAINPACSVRAEKAFYLPETACRFDFKQYDYIVDAVDTVTAKLQIIEESNRCVTPVISCMGAANKLDPTRFMVADIYDTSVCPLAKIIRKECRKRNIAHLKVVYSTEAPLKPQVDTQQPVFEDEPPKRSGIPGSTPFVPPVAGLIAASEVVKDLLAAAQA